eukprot:Em0725g2a
MDPHVGKGFQFSLLDSLNSLLHAFWLLVFCGLSLIPELATSQIKKKRTRFSNAGGSPRVWTPRLTLAPRSCKTLCLIAIKVLVRVLLFSIVVTCTVFSKLSLISLVSRLNKTIDDIRRTNDSEATLHDRAAGFFWQLLFIILIPQFVTLFRALLFGVCGKQSRLFPWPTLRAILMAFEVVAMTTVVFYVLPRLHSIVAILALGGVFGAQAILDCLEWCPCCVRKGYHKLHNTNGNINFNENEDQTNCLTEDCAEGKTGAWNKFSRIIAMFLQFVSVILLSIYASLLQSGPKDQFLVGFAMTLSLLSLSVVWSSKVQQGSQKMAKMTQSSNITCIRSNEKNQKSNVINEKEPILPTARYKATKCDGCGASFTLQHTLVCKKEGQVILCHNEYHDCIGDMARQVWPQVIKEPIGIEATVATDFINAILRITLYPFISYVIFRYVFTNGSIDPWCLHQTCSLSKSFQWKGQELAIFLIQILSSFFGYTFMWISCTMVLHRWGLALPLYLCTPISFAVGPGVAIVVGAMLWIGQILTMGVFVWKKKNLILAKDAAIFLTPCYDGVFLEQRSMLNRQVTKEEMSPEMIFDDDESRPRTVFISACHCKEKKNDDHFELHIFLDGGANGIQITYFALQLFSLFEETLHVDALHLESKAFQRINTPYGVQLSWEIAEAMPIYVHLKDSTKIKNKKRWSQGQHVDEPTQRIWRDLLVPVLCCPGCFSVFRCRALRSVLDTYSTEVTSASEFLTKDMGEDRWLVTLLVENGWKLEYCPTSENYTHCLKALRNSLSSAEDGFPPLLPTSHSLSLRPPSIAYGIFCIYGNPEHQLNVAKLATFVFAIIMGVVFVGNFKSIIYDFLTVGENYQPCTIKTTITSKCHNSTGFMVPLTPSTLYLSLFTLLFIISGLFHLNEFSCLFYGVWYFLALPSGYLILLIYSVANLNKRSWGDKRRQFWGTSRGTRKQKMAEENKQLPISCDAATGKRVSLIRTHGATDMGYYLIFRGLLEGISKLAYLTEVLLLINIMWIVLLYTLQFPELYKFNLPTKAFELFYLAVYASIIFVQFCAMIVHRGVTLIHYLASVGFCY